jgi:predicted phosphodiesterase
LAWDYFCGYAFYWKHSCILQQPTEKKAFQIEETSILDTSSGNNTVGSTNPSIQPDSSVSSSTSNNGSASTQSSSPKNNISSGNSDNENSSTSGDNSESTPVNNPTPPEVLSATVAFYADSQTDNNPVGEEENHQRVVNYILGTSANPIFHVGDLMEDGTQASLDSFNAVTTTLRASRSFYSAIGNNERNSSLYFNNFIFPNNEKWYSVNIGNLHMIILDSVYSASDPSQLSWLQSDLQSAASQNRITGVMYHYPTYSNTIGSILTNNNVDFVVAGHNHFYAHTTSNGVHYFVCSGQQSIGYLLAKVYSSTISISAYNSSNGLIETISIPNR